MIFTLGREVVLPSRNDVRSGTNPYSERVVSDGWKAAERQADAEKKIDLEAPNGFRNNPGPFPGRVGE